MPDVLGLALCFPMTALVIALLLSQDAGVDAGRPAIVISAGQPAPFDGVLQDDARALYTTKRLVKAEAEAAACLAFVEPPPISTPALVTAAGVVLSGIASAFGAGVAYEQGQRR